ncbi:MAG: hypothetical protein IT289_10405 [Oligoflexia bacterium]|nr:hypothetical protein [Oligoflexia bacterium]
MAKIDSKNESPGHRIDKTKPYVDGPHRDRRGREKALAKEDPAYHVKISRKQSEEEASQEIPDLATGRYAPEETRAKARKLLSSNQLSSEQRKVLEEILGPDKQK